MTREARRRLSADDFKLSVFHVHCLRTATQYVYFKSASDLLSKQINMVVYTFKVGRACQATETALACTDTRSTPDVIDYNIYCTPH